jgi:hypothetical protein
MLDENQVVFAVNAKKMRVRAGAKIRIEIGHQIWYGGRRAFWARPIF